MSSRYVDCSSCGADLPVARPEGSPTMPGEIEEHMAQAQRDHDPVCPAKVVTWLDLAEQQEMLAKAWTLRARSKPARLRAAALDDAADAVGMAASYRMAHANGAKLNQGLAEFLSVVQ